MVQLYCETLIHLHCHEANCVTLLWNSDLLESTKDFIEQLCCEALIYYDVLSGSHYRTGLGFNTPFMLPCGKKYLQPMKYLNTERSLQSTSSDLCHVSH